MSSRVFVFGSRTLYFAPRNRSYAVLKQAVFDSTLGVLAGQELPLPPPPPPPLHSAPLAERDSAPWRSAQSPPPPPPPRSSEMMRTSSNQGVISSSNSWEPPPPRPPRSLEMPDYTSGVQSVPNSSECGPDEILLAMKSQGAKAVLTNLWPRIEELEKDGRFTLAHISAMFEMGSTQQAMARESIAHSNRKYQMVNGEIILPVGTRIVQLFSNYVCERIIELTPDQVTIFVKALTSPCFSQDEFWLFMLAKRIQDTTDLYSPEQIIAVADRYAVKGLEDDEFFTALSQSVMRRFKEFSPSDLVMFLHSCARLRFLDEDLCRATMAYFLDPACVTQQSVQTLATALTAASLLDLSFFEPLTCCRHLAADAKLRDLIAGSMDIFVGAMLSMAYLRNSIGLRLVLPPLLQKVAASRFLLPRQGRSSPHELGLLYRRATLLALCAAFGIPDTNAWPLQTILKLADVQQKLQSALIERGLANRGFDPASSSFHLEVVAVLQLLDVKHALEHAQHPFHLDITVSPAQRDAALHKWSLSATSTPAIAWPPASTGSEALWPSSPHEQN